MACVPLPVRDGPGNLFDSSTRELPTGVFRDLLPLGDDGPCSVGHPTFADRPPYNETNGVVQNPARFIKDVGAIAPQSAHTSPFAAAAHPRHDLTRPRRQPRPTSPPRRPHTVHAMRRSVSKLARRWRRHVRSTTTLTAWASRRRKATDRVQCIRDTEVPRPSPAPSTPRDGPRDACSRPHSPPHPPYVEKS